MALRLEEITAVCRFPSFCFNTSSNLRRCCNTWQNVGKSSPFRSPKAVCLIGRQSLKQKSARPAMLGRANPDPRHHSVKINLSKKMEGKSRNNSEVQKFTKQTPSIYAMFGFCGRMECSNSRPRGTLCPEQATRARNLVSALSQHQVVN